MRISDWSSDVCSSDLLRSEDRPEWGDQREKQREQTPEPGLGELFGKLIHDLRTYAGAEIGLLQTSYTLKWRALRIAVLALVVGGLLCLSAFMSLLVGLVIGLAPIIGPFVATLVVSLGAAAVGAIMGIAAGRNLRRPLSNGGKPDRSEEHTSDLPSLMRISYDVFCLEKKKRH